MNMTFEFHIVALANYERHILPRIHPCYAVVQTSTHTKWVIQVFAKT